MPGLTLKDLLKEDVSGSNTAIIFINGDIPVQFEPGTTVAELMSQNSGVANIAVSSIEEYREIVNGSFRNISGSTIVKSADSGVKYSVHTRLQEKGLSSLT